MTIVSNPKLNTGWGVKLVFKIALSKKDLYLLESVKNFFSVGKIYIHSHSCELRIESAKDLRILISHFDRFELITQKRIDFEHLSKVFDLMQNKEHLTNEGLHKILTIRASWNLGLSDTLQAAFPSIVPVVIPRFINDKSLDPNWLAGFTSAEGCFILDISDASDRKAGGQVRLSFDITQHLRDEQLMRSFVEFFGCGVVYKNRETFRYLVSKFSDIHEKVIPFFQKYPIEGKKYKDFQDWCKVAEMMKEKQHLTVEGLNKIREIKAGMNSGRD